MNLKKRLKKIEKVVINDSPVCVCEGRKRFEVSKVRIDYDPYETGSYVPDQHSERAKIFEAERKDKPETIKLCDRCGKPVNHCRVILVGINTSLD